MKANLAIFILLILIAIPTLLLYSQSLLISVGHPNSHCLPKNPKGYSLCAYCIDRSDIPISQTSNIIVQGQKDFFSMKIPYQGLLICQQLIQFFQTSSLSTYQQTSDLILQRSQTIDKIVELVQIQISEQPLTSSNIQPMYQSVAVLQVIKHENVEGNQLSYKYSPEGSEGIVDLSGRVISLGSLICSILVICYTFFEQGCGCARNLFCSEFSSVVGVLAINIMMTASSFMGYTHLLSQYLQEYSLCLFLVVLMTKARPHRLVILLALICSYFVLNSIYKALLFFWATLVTKCYTMKKDGQQNPGMNKYIVRILAICTIVTFCQQVSQQVIPSPICAISMQVFICVGSLALEFVCQSSNSIKYQKLKVQTGNQGSNSMSEEQIRPAN